MSNDMANVLDRRIPIYTQEQVDQLILTPEVRATLITKKKPKFKKIPIFALDNKGEKIPLLDESGNYLVNEDGSMKYLIKDYKYVQAGWQSKMEVVPASEIFNIDLGTSDISGEAVRFLLHAMFRYNHILKLHQLTDTDYSVILHGIRNDVTAVPNAAKSYKGGTVQKIKTFRTISDSNQFIRDQQDQNKKKGFKDMIFGGMPKKQEAPSRDNFTAYA